MLLFRENFAQHRPWIAFLVLGTLAAVLWYVEEAIRGGSWPGGSSVSGFTFGVLAGLIIVFEFLLWPRKKVRAWRLFGPAKLWMRMHIWLGLLSVPLVAMHCSFALGGPLTTALTLTFAVVILSGVWGLAMQQYLPRRMFDEVPGETIHSQVDRLMSATADDMHHILDSLLGADADTAPLVAASVAVAGRLQGKVLHTLHHIGSVAGIEPLLDFFFHRADPYLRGLAPRSPLASVNQANRLFGELRSAVPPDAHPVVDLLASYCDQRRQLDHQRRLHFWLHNWLCVHLPLSAALLVLMIVHIWSALKYW